MECRFSGDDDDDDDDDVVVVGHVRFLQIVVVPSFCVVDIGHATQTDMRKRQHRGIRHCRAKGLGRDNGKQKVGSRAVETVTGREAERVRLHWENVQSSFAGGRVPGAVLFQQMSWYTKHTALRGHVDRVDSQQ